MTTPGDNGEVASTPGTVHSGDLPPEDPVTSDEAAAAPIIGEWFHSHEEDSPGVRVYRPSSFEFPRARMPRDSIAFSAGGEADLGQPGPTDRADRTPASWDLVGEQVVVDTDDGHTLRFIIDEQDHAARLIRTAEPEGPDHAHQAEG